MVRAKSLRRNKYSQKEAYIFILPILLLFFIYVAYPIIFNFYHSFFDWNGMSADKTYVGWSNYAKILQDRVFGILVKNFVIFGAVTILTQCALGMIFASIFMSKIKLTSVYRTIFYVPVVATPVVVGNIFSKIFETNRGELNTILRTLNLDFLTQQWLADPKVALYAIAMVNIWQWTGYSMLVYYANMLSIPDDLYEAATIDGAGTVKKFFSITLPLLRSSHFTLFVLGALGTLKCFDLPFVLTKGGPNYATEFFSTYIYKKSFDLFDQGGASTLVVLMFIIAIIITVAQLVIYTRNDKNKEMS
ncbi:MAG: raffinose/stachyose/melibiose transport system permease protein [Clostridiales bacterium]|jgi:raffinose/stachyose/melibiose transport system permease protein|nr:raffinose/stachyose/melibiose transport system permease protein [Clostridiales bacterium]